ncbi:MAG: hypothetical protein U5K77_01560 [Candidatus Saccharibacteria bacterium]|nr:hypothetical protein [Candidatus Saccharibacteria bacterium]
MFGDDKQKNDEQSQDMSTMALPPQQQPESPDSSEDSNGQTPTDSNQSDNSTPPADQPKKSDDKKIDDIQMTAPEPVADTNTPPQASHDDDETGLLDIKKEALSQLGPLVGHLDQSPEEKFRTTMMMIQATDDQSMVKDAYDAAQAISDDKARAQALLDVINEINYFTQKDSN